MAQQPDNTDQARGFSGLDSMVSDVSKDVEHAKFVGRSSQSRSEVAARRDTDQTAVASTASGSADASSVQTSHGVVESQGASESPGSSSANWVLGIGALIIFVLWLIGQSSKKENPIYDPPPVAFSTPPAIPSPIPAPTPTSPTTPRLSSGFGEKPPIGEGHTLNREQLRYCVVEKIRLDAIETVINAYRSLEVDKFNVLVADYNSRCGRFRYQRGSLESVRAEVEARRSEIALNAQTAWVRDSTGIVGR